MCKALLLLCSFLDNYLACSRFEGGCFLLRRTKCLVDSFYIALVLPVQQQTHANTELRSSQYSFAQRLVQTVEPLGFAHLRRPIMHPTKKAVLFPPQISCLFFYEVASGRFFLAIYLVGIKKNFRLFIPARVT